eukprot:scaffold105633_cov42-Phaeocystis_antarctica.AAC.1
MDSMLGAADIQEMLVSSGTPGISTYYSRLTTHYSLLTTHHSPLTTYQGVPLLGVVPESADVLKSTNVGRPVILQA